MPPASRVPPPSEEHQIGARKRRAPGEHHPQPTIPPPCLNLLAESRRHPVGCISRGLVRPYTRRKDPPTLIPQNKVLEGEGKRYMIYIHTTKIYKRQQPLLELPLGGLSAVNASSMGHTYSNSVYQPGKVANPARGQLDRENKHFPVRVRACEIGLARRVRQSRPASACSSPYSG